MSAEVHRNSRAYTHMRRHRRTNTPPFPLFIAMKGYIEPAAGIAPPANLRPNTTPFSGRVKRGARVGGRVEFFRFNLSRVRILVYESTHEETIPCLSSSRLFDLRSLYGPFAFAR